MARCTCAGCGEVFGGVRAFDMHQTWTPGLSCHPPGERGLVRGARGTWVRPLVAGSPVPGAATALRAPESPDPVPEYPPA